MATWHEFEQSSPEIAAAGRKLLYQFGPGLGFLATVRKDGGPRVHPICPFIFEGALYAFILNKSPKHSDLVRDGRYALHTFPPQAVDDEFYLSGRVTRVEDQSLRERCAAAYKAQGTMGATDQESLFAFDIENAMLAVYKSRPSWPPAYSKWRAARSIS
jgi:hypothetical protein